MKNKVQILILCPTRELAVQACGELKKLAAYMHGIRVVDVYGGAPMDRQIIKLKTANIVVGTPGRVMDHMRRKTLRLNHLKMIILDEADEMLSMGFREDIETILNDAPTERQTVLFSATMPPAILKLTKEFQHDPQLIEINREQITVSEIEQYFYEVPMGRKTDALNLILRYHRPSRAIIFCNTKKMVDDISDYLNGNGFAAEGLHGDMKQSQRTKVMDAFKQGRTAILIATDVAARGIDVSDIDFVINYDIPQNPEYYVHRIGRTGRAGKSGKAISICSGRRQVQELMLTAKQTKSKLIRCQLPRTSDIVSRQFEQNMTKVADTIAREDCSQYQAMVAQLIQSGHTPEQVAAAALFLQFGQSEPIGSLEDSTDWIKEKDFGKQGRRGGRFGKIIINIGRDQHIAPNHLVGAIAERTHLSGSDIGKIEIYDDKSLVAVPQNEIASVIEEMKGCKICGHATITTPQQPKESGQTSFRGVKKKRGRRIR